MYEYFAFVDESTAKRYRLCLVAIPSGELKGTRTQLLKLRLKGQTRIHMHTESHRRRKEIISAINSLPSWKCVMLETTVRNSNFVQARKDLFLVAAGLPIFRLIKHLTIEDSTEKVRDRQLLTWIKNNMNQDFEFAFEKPANSECLWIADVLAWAYSRGGETRKSVAKRIEVVSTPF